MLPKTDSNSEHIGILLPISSALESGSCILQSLHQSNLHSEEFSNQLSLLINQGYTLRSMPPGGQCNLAEHWLGSRLYFCHQSAYQDSRKLVGIACSQLGKQHQNLPHWPQLVDDILTEIRRRNQRLLVADQTTLASALEELAFRSEVDFLQVCFAKAKEDWHRWLLETIPRFAASHNLARKTLYVSPTTDSKMQLIGPIQDVANVFLADRLFGLAIRKSGKIAKLLEQRLLSQQFDAGSVFVLLHDAVEIQKGTRQSASSSLRHNRFWMNLGAVGWRPSKQFIAPVDEPCFRSTAQTGCLQLTSALPEAVFDTEPSGRRAGKWLIHCTRGTMFQPHESQQGSLYRHWISGEALHSSPWMQLNKICYQRRLVGSKFLQRCNREVVSLSDVPLPRLLSQRSFRPHLGRWDWEPYGLMISRAAIERLGGRPVIYGDEADYERLLPDQLPFFQPGGETYDWRLEEEWRVLGDLDLSRLQTDEVRIFTRLKREALQLSLCSRWPVFWLET
ncbi:MAG: hypothetical protein AAF483_03950 [Planctomycetota bacterium]